MPDYTTSIEETYRWGGAERIAAETRRRLENMDEKATAEEWKRELDKIGEEYTCSARRFLMNYLYENRSGVEDEEGLYIFTFFGKEYKFHVEVLERVEELGDSERDQYIELFSEIAADNHNDEAKKWLPLFRKAMLRNKTVKLLTREDGFKLAHGLRLNLDQAEELLLRVLENDSFNYTRSDDLIEAFCFLHIPSNNYYTACEIKERYQQKSKDIEKKEIFFKPEDFTKKTGAELPELTAGWEKAADTKEGVIELFMDWLLSKASFLDIPSRNAYSIYRNLACCTYEMIQKIKVDMDENVLDSYHIPMLDPDTADEEIWIEDLRDKCIEGKGKLPDNVSIYDLANTLFDYSRLEYDNKRKHETKKIWRYLTVNKQGKVTVEKIGNRVLDLLQGKSNVNKADLLFLLWYTCDIFWLLKDYSDVDRVTQNDYRIDDFWMLADDLLEAALLPRFYIPHLLERSFLYAIRAELYSKDTPFAVYEEICDIIDVPRKKEKKEEPYIPPSPNGTKKDRKAMEESVKADFGKGLIDFEGIDTELITHFEKHIHEKGKYTFLPEGIFYTPNPKAAYIDPNEKAVILYKSEVTGRRFDQSRVDYRDSEPEKERFCFVYGLSLLLISWAKEKQFDCTFRVNFRDNVYLTLTKVEIL